MAKLKHICRCFEGEHDFKAYSKSGSSAKTTVRTIYSVSVEETSYAYGTRVDIRVTGNGFLYNMVRTLVGTALYYAQGVLTEEDVRRSLDGGDRNSVGKTMPARGLTLESVEYADFTVLSQNRFNFNNNQR